MSVLLESTKTPDTIMHLRDEKAGQRVRKLVVHEKLHEVFKTMRSIWHAA